MGKIRSAGYEIRDRLPTLSCNRLDEVSKVKRLPHFLFPVLSCAYLHRFCVTSIATVTLNALSAQNALQIHFSSICI